MTMKEIWKYPVPTRSGVFTLEMPIDAKVLCVQMQGDTPQLWAEVITNQDKRTRVFTVYMTGQAEYNIYGRYVGTFQYGWFVGHVYEG